MSLTLMGRKKGMTRIFDEQGNAIVCTAIELQPNVVSQVKTAEKDGYTAVQIAAYQVSASKKKNVSKPLAGHFAKSKIEPRKFLKETRVSSVESFQDGKEITIDYFAESPFVDITGVSKGKGFQGVMKRYNFSGGPASHGSGFHRHSGSFGMRSTPGRIFPQKKMAGRMGGEKTTVENLQVVRLLPESNVMLVKGAVPGAREGLVYVRQSLKKTKEQR